MTRIWSVLALALVMTGSASAVVTTKATAEQQVTVTRNLEAIKPGDQATQDKAEDDLAALGTDYLPVLRHVLAEQQTALTKAEASDETLGDAYTIRSHTQALDSAIIRLTWKINPRVIMNDYLATLKDFNGQPFTMSGQTYRVTAPSVAQVFPKVLFYVMRFRMYPVARILPEPLKANNLFILSADGKLTQVADVESLQKHFLAVTPANKTLIPAIVTAWLCLSQELAQDGMFRFIAPTKVVQTPHADGAISASAEVAVDTRGGNQGKISVTMTFTAKGKVTDIQEARTLKAGMRPICQATKLLDPDPIVRRMAEQDLLLMGRAAESYLVERRALATPALQAAIDKIWAQIVADGR